MELHYLSSSEIDKTKWNSCVHYAVNGNVFGYKWYLDAVAREWDAIVEGDYESVLPLPYKKDWLGRKYIYQPELMRELGVYSIHVLSPARVRKILEAIPKEFNRIRIDMNEQVGLPEGLGYLVAEKTNYQLLLDSPYEEIAEHYSRDLLLKLETAEKNNLRAVTGIKPEKVANFYKEHFSWHKDKEHNFHALHRIMYNILHRGWGNSGAVQNEKGELLAVNFYIYSHSKILSLTPVVSEEGKKLGAQEHLMNMLVMTQEKKRMILDFNMSSENEFAKQFGATANAFNSIKKGSKFWWR